MQHIASSTLSWSADDQSYALSDAQRREVRRLPIEDPAWFAWLEGVSSFAFHGQRGSFTARIPALGILASGGAIVAWAARGLSRNRSIG